MAATGVTLNKLMYDLWEVVRQYITDDDFLDKRKFKEWIHNQRALWIRNELNKNHTIDDNLIQDLGCLELERADASSCCDLPLGCTILRTKKELPVTIERHNEPTFIRIGPINRTLKPYTLISYSRAPYVTDGKFSRNQVYVFLLNKRLYIVSGNSQDPQLKLLKYINVLAVLENPEEAAIFKTCSGTICFTEDSPYPINRWMIPYLKDAIIKADLSYIMKAGADSTNDGSSEIKADENAFGNTVR